MSAAHTPGPWRVEPDIWEKTCKHTGDDLSFVQGYNILSDAGEVVGCEGILACGEANARLIAAAPALLDLLCDALEIIDDQMPGEFPAFSTDARAAISLAKGEAK